MDRDLWEEAVGQGGVKPRMDTDGHGCCGAGRGEWVWGKGLEASGGSHGGTETRGGGCGAVLDRITGWTGIFGKRLWGRGKRKPRMDTDEHGCCGADLDRITG